VIKKNKKFNWYQDFYKFVSLIKITDKNQIVCQDSVKSLLRQR